MQGGTRRPRGVSRWFQGEIQQKCGTYLGRIHGEYERICVRRFEDRMTKPVSNIDAEKLVRHLFGNDEGLPCFEGTNLLIAFAEARPIDFAFLKAEDLIELQNPAFAGIPEWEAFTRHYATCGLCNA